MKVTYNWLKDFVEIKIPAPELAEKLTMAGLEVTSLEEKGGDFILEIEITSNRPDWLSVIGIAREVAAITNSKFSATKRGGSTKNYGGKTQEPKNKENVLTIEIEDKKDCPFYTARIIKGVKVGPSPDWLKARLELVGCRSISNIVDITNYVLFEYGEPLHAFDLDKLSGDKIIIRRARAGEKITTIDGQEKALGPETLLIADQDKPAAVAGVMGAKNTEVSWNTKNILLEAAIFSPIVVRKSRRALGLESESSYRFERGVDPRAVEAASRRAAALICELASGECLLAQSAGSAKEKETNVSLNAGTAQKILGLKIPAARIRGILTALGFSLRQKAKDNFSVKIPSFRQDVHLDVDLIEELARVYGYDKLPTTLPKVSPGPEVSDARSLVSLAKVALVGMGLDEVITYSLIDQDDLKDCAAYEPIAILNPLSKEQGVLRPTVIPGLLRCVAVNLNQKQPFISIFEIAKAFRKDSGSPREEWVLAVALCGAKSFFVSGQGLVKEEAGLLHLKGILEALFSRLGVDDYNFSSAQGCSETKLEVKKEKLGSLWDIPKPVAERFGVKNKAVVAFEVSLEKLLPYVSLGKKFMPLPKYPGISRDISLLLKEAIRAQDLLTLIRGQGGTLLQEAQVTDYYKGRQIPDGYKGLTISCLYRSDERTLTEPEVAQLHSAICELLSEKFGAKIR